MCASRLRGVPWHQQKRATYTSLKWLASSNITEYGFYGESTSSRNKLATRIVDDVLRVSIYRYSQIDSGGSSVLRICSGALLDALF
jgi:hypothetical protein